MAKEYWRNWDELYCVCGYRTYKKYALKKKGQYICKQCGKKLKERKD